MENKAVTKKARGTAKTENSPEAVTRTISSANHFDLNALEKNRSGKLSASQFLNAFQVLGLVLLMLIGIAFILRNIYVGGIFLNSGEFQQAIFPCGGSLVVFVVVLLLVNLGGRFGMERYLARNPRDLLTKTLVVVDLLLGRVDLLEGTVSRSTETVTTYTKKENGSRDSQTQTHYFYIVDGNEFKVSEEGYSAFPSKPRNCRLYYLPSSRVIVNLEVL